MVPVSSMMVVARTGPTPGTVAKLAKDSRFSQSLVDALRACISPTAKPDEALAALRILLHRAVGGRRKGDSAEVASSMLGREIEGMTNRSFNPYASGGFHRTVMR